MNVYVEKTILDSQYHYAHGEQFRVQTGHIGKNHIIEWNSYFVTLWIWTKRCSREQSFKVLINSISCLFPSFRLEEDRPHSNFSNTKHSFRVLIAVTNPRWPPTSLNVVLYLFEWRGRPQSMKIFSLHVARRVPQQCRITSETSIEKEQKNVLIRSVLVEFTHNDF